MRFGMNSYQNMNETAPAGNGIDNRGTAGIPDKDVDRKLFVGGLTRQTAEKELRDYFGKYGGIESVSVKMDPHTGQSRGFAFIVFSDAKSVETILSSDHYIDGRKVDTKHVTKKVQHGKIFIGGLTPDITDEDIRNHFSQYGTIVEIQAPFDKVKNQRKGFCFITFDNKNVIYELLKIPKQCIKGKDVDVKSVRLSPEGVALNPAAHMPGWGMNPPFPGGYPQHGKIFVGGLTPAITDEDILNHFSQYGTIVEIQTPFDKVKNQRKGFCFITFANKNVIYQLLKIPKQYIKGKDVDVKSVKQNPESVALNPAVQMPTPDMPGWGMSPPFPGGYPLHYGAPTYNYGEYGSPYGNDYSSYGYPNVVPDQPYGPKSRGPGRQFQRHQPY